MAWQQSRLRRSMEAENINVEEYFFQLELEEETTKIQENEVPQCSAEVMDMDTILAALEAFVSTVVSSVRNRVK